MSVDRPRPSGISLFFLSSTEFGWGVNQLLKWYKKHDRIRPKQISVVQENELLKNNHNFYDYSELYGIEKEMLHTNALDFISKYKLPITINDLHSPQDQLSFSKKIIINFLINIIIDFEIIIFSEDILLKLMEDFPSISSSLLEISITQKIVLIGENLKNLSDFKHDEFDGTDFKNHHHLSLIKAA